MIAARDASHPVCVKRAPLRLVHLAAWLPVMASLAAWASQAVPLRDPTEPAAAFRARPAAQAGIEALRPEHLVTVGDTRYLVWMGRRYGVGDSVQGARIERLEETAVWLRRGGELRRVPVFAGVEKLPPTPRAPGSTARPE